MPCTVIQKEKKKKKLQCEEKENSKALRPWNISMLLCAPIRKIPNPRSHACSLIHLVFCLLTLQIL